MLYFVPFLQNMICFKEGEPIICLLVSLCGNIAGKPLLSINDPTHGNFSQ